MIRGRGHRPYKPPQLLTGHVDDFPLVPETPITLPSRFEDRAPEATQTGLPVSTQDRAPEATPNRPPSVDAGQGSRGHGEWRSGDLSSLGDQTRSGDRRAGEIERAREISRDPTDHREPRDRFSLRPPHRPPKNPPHRCHDSTRIGIPRDHREPRDAPFSECPRRRPPKNLPYRRHDSTRIGIPRDHREPRGKCPPPSPPRLPPAKPVIEVLEAAKELAVTAPSVANEVLRILESEELLLQKPQP